MQQKYMALVKSCKEKTEPESKEAFRSNYQFIRILKMEEYVQDTPKMSAKSRIKTNSRGQMIWFLQQMNSIWKGFFIIDLNRFKTFQPNVMCGNFWILIQTKQQCKDIFETEDWTHARY